MIDLKPLISGKDLNVWMIYSQGVKVKVKFLTEDVVLMMRDRCLNDKGKCDERKLRLMMSEEAILDWDGFMDGKKKLVCNKENIRIVLDKLTAFPLWVQTMCVEYVVLMNYQMATEKKRSGRGSKQKRSTQK